MSNREAMRAEAHPVEILSGEDIQRLVALGLTTSEVAHDLGNLLQIVGSAVRLIDRGLGQACSPDLSPLIGGALSSVDRATALSRRLLDSAQAPHEPVARVYLDTVLAGIRNMILLAAGPAVAVELVVGEGLPAIRCDRHELENVILNLVSNARDAMHGAGRLIIAIEREVPDREAIAGISPGLSLRVTDTGCGMSPETAARAFQPFFTTKPRGRGTGLGLALAGAFAQRLGGSADIDSRIGEGTAITLHLPCSGRCTATPPHPKGKGR